jgi:mRNA interferase MazF
MTKEFPKRGEIWMVNFNPGRGSEQKGIRPALIIQNDTGNRYAATTIIAAITSTIKLYPVTVFISSKTFGLSKDSIVNLAQLLTVDKSRLIKRIGALSTELINKIDDAIKISLAC